VACVAALALAWERAGRPATPRNVLLITLDTVRADRLGSYGYASARTPRLDALARSGARFENAFTVTPLTLPAHASLMTGLFPGEHGVRDNGGFYLEDRIETLAEALRARGYRTGGFVGAFVLDRRWGIAQGFDEYFDDFDLDAAGAGAMDDVQRPGSVVVERALAWLGRERAGRFFAWVHLYDAHTPYEAPEPYRRMFPATVSGAYDAEVASVDEQVGRLLDGLASRGVLDHTLIAVVSDHGESLGEHGEQTHGFFLYDATLRVPLLIAGRGVPRVTVADPVRLVDVMPTLLDLLGLPVSAHGASLRPLLRGERLRLPVIAETFYPRHHYGWSELFVLRDDRFKLVRAPRPELFDLSRDPGEGQDLATVAPERLASLDAALGALLARHGGDRPKPPAALDAETEERLRALGYIGAGSASQSDGRRARADPKDKIHLYNRIKESLGLSRAGREENARQTLRRVLAEDPGIVQAHVLLGSLELRAGRPREAERAFRAALALDGSDASAAFNLALAYKDQGRLGEAESGFERARTLDPRDGKPRWHLADIWMRRGELDRARILLEESLSLPVDRPSFLLKLGECLIELARLDEAEARLGQALAARPNLARAHYGLGLVHEARGDLKSARAAYEAELASSPSTWAAAFNLGKLLLRDGRAADARERLRHVVQANPEFAGGHVYLAKALLDVGDLPGAERSARAGLRLTREDALTSFGHWLLADALTRQGRLAAARREAASAERLERRLSADPPENARWRAGSHR
jgi:arylsulfatase A-like enzyme/Flp pilus assembly protein TadD